MEYWFLLVKVFKHPNPNFLDEDLIRDVCERLDLIRKELGLTMDEVKIFRKKIKRKVKEESKMLKKQR